MPNWVRNNVCFRGTKERMESVKAALKVNDEQWFSLDKLVKMPDIIKANDEGVPSRQIIFEEMFYYLTDRCEGSISAKDVTLLTHFVMADRMFPITVSSTKKIKDSVEKYYDGTPKDAEDVEKAYQRGKSWYNCLKETRFTNWYDWSVENWGTKWDVSAEDVTEEPAIYPAENGLYELCYSFDTAWSTPAAAFESFIDNNKDLSVEINYADEDIGSNCGIYGYDPKNGFYEVTPEYGEVSRKFACDTWGYDPEDFEY